jgi:hypothetical protein
VLLLYNRKNNQTKTHLSLSHVSQTTNGRSDGGSGSGGNGVSTTGNSLAAGLAVPDTSSVSLHSSLTAERAVVLGVLLDLHLLGLSSQGRTISDTELTGDSDLLCSLSPETLVLRWIENHKVKYKLGDFKLSGLEYGRLGARETLISQSQRQARPWFTESTTSQRTLPTHSSHIESP